MPASLQRSASTASEAPAKASKFKDALEDGDHSSFKRHRLAEFAKDEESEDPLYTELYPRIQSSPSRMTVEEFMETFDERMKEADAPPVALNGRVRRIHVVGNNLIFLDVVNEFRKVQVMLSRKKCIPDHVLGKQKFSMFKHLIQVGDHICKLDHKEPILGLNVGSHFSQRLKASPP